MLINWIKKNFRFLARGKSRHFLLKRTFFIYIYTKNDVNICIVWWRLVSKQCIYLHHFRYICTWKKVHFERKCGIFFRGWKSDFFYSVDEQKKNNSLSPWLILLSYEKPANKHIFLWSALQGILMCDLLIAGFNGQHRVWVGAAWVRSILLKFLWAHEKNWTRMVEDVGRNPGVLSRERFFIRTGNRQRNIFFNVSLTNNMKDKSSVLLQAISNAWTNTTIHYLYK